LFPVGNDNFFAQFFGENISKIIHRSLVTLDANDKCYKIEENMLHLFSSRMFSNIFGTERFL
jgi:hypothetical protein